MTTTAPQLIPTTEFVRTLEVARTQSLVGREIELARELHTPEYQLITPSGRTFDRESYLGEIEAGTLRYVEWEIGEASVRASPCMAVIRYLARLEFPSGKVVKCWHTDSYELQGTRWLAVWSQATAIPPSA